MTIALVDVVVNSTWLNSRSPVMTLPAGLSAGDILVYALNLNQNQGTTAITGHTKIGVNAAEGNNQSLSAFHYEITGSEGASITLTNIIDSNDSGHIACSAWRGVDTTTPINAEAKVVTTSGATLSGPSITPTVDGCEIAQYGCQGSYLGGTKTTTGTPDASPVATEINEYIDGNDTFSYIQHYNQVTAAAIALDATFTDTDVYLGKQIALTPAAAGGPASQTITATGIATAEAIGAATVVPGAVAVAPGGIGSSEALGLLALAPGAVSISVGGIASLESFGTLTLQNGVVTLLPSGIVSGEAMGAPSLVPGAVTVTVNGIGSDEAFGVPVAVAGAVALLPGGIVSGEAWGTPGLVAGVVTLVPAGIATSEAFGTLVMIGGVNSLGELLGEVDVLPSVGGLIYVSPSIDGALDVFAGLDGRATMH